MSRPRTSPTVATAGPSGESSGDDTELHSLPLDELERFLKRRRANPSFELNLEDNLVEVLRKANEFVPSEAGSILLDDPVEKHRNRQANSLTFIAAFGDASSQILGRSISADRGIAGHVYTTGETYVTSDARQDTFFFAGFDKETDYSTRSMVAIPIRIEQEVCGVLELINRQDARAYSAHDRNLLEIFAGYISVSIQNVLDGRQAQEIAKRDNLTGLYNDRYLHIALTREVEGCWSRRSDLSVLFLDLDYFKRVNDTHGHLAGSQVLREVGDILREKTEAQGAVAARYGGDEFVVVAPLASLSQAVDLAEDVRTTIVESTFCQAPGEIQPEALHLSGLTCSVGVANLARHLTDDESDGPDAAKSTLLRLADAAMYVAKETGRNRTAIAGEPVRRRR